MTYKELISQLRKLNPDQLECDVIVEIALENECYPISEIRICDSEHDHLDEWHPVLYLK